MAAGLIAVSWPKEYGGGGYSPVEQVVLAEEFARAGAPEREENDLFGVDLLCNTLIALGTEAQKRHFLPRILTGDDRWCQGFSEPRPARIWPPCGPEPYSMVTSG
ncbi:acyl-CoA dehydrogenase, N-terminal domain protein [Mycobacterium ulcerans str. Harvey]|uniref:Acyl-CoA dehydrogenase, N-terminal domain protein n=1 Tax=Mycobacterium ulcerans str. Harvey TaxID=1299332 RepID=A0ABP3ADQ4_MYCUL|nr:acyl-CoA dehydrogenase, N-terminal domain protein [Mycobacterium ulcerans str. Harvey]